MAIAIRWVIVLSISVGAIWLAFRSVAWTELYQAITEMQYEYLPLAVASLYLSIWARTERWRLLLAPSTRIKRRLLFSSLLIGYLGISILPFRLGEAARVYAANRLAGVSIADAFTALLVEHILDLATLVLLLAWQWPSLKTLEWVQTIYLFGIGLLVVSLIFLGGMIVFSAKVLVLLEKFSQIAPDWAKRLGVFQAFSTGVIGIGRMRNGKLLGVLGFWSLVTWFFACCFNGAFLLAVNIQGVVQGSVLTVICTNFAALIPSTPGYIGVYDLASVAALSILEVPSVSALAFALTSHFSLLLIFVISGVVALLVNGLGWRSFKRDVEGLRINSQTDMNHP